MGKRVVIAIALVAAVLLVGYAGYSLIFAEPQLPAVVDTAAPEPVTSGTVAVVAIEVSRVHGTVERRPPGGDWTAVAAGTILAANDEVRTRGEGRAELRIGGGTTLTVAEETQLSTADVTTTLSQLKLQGGRLSATVRGNGPRMQVEVEGSDAKAETREGDFSILSSAEGEVVVATERGNVQLSAKGEKVDVGAGTLSIVEKGKAPSAPQRIPSSLFLKIGRPGKLFYRRNQTIAVKGKTTPGAVVSVNGVRASVDAEGNFEAEVELKEGANEIAVAARDVLGRKEGGALPTITVDSKPPKVESEVTF